MRNLYDFLTLRESHPVRRRYIMGCVSRFFPAFLFGMLAVVITSRADGDGRELPFDPAKISRLSLDGIPRSISIRQGADIWLGYDLEKAVVSKVWKAPKGKPGLLVKGFKTLSVGTTWFQIKTGEVWQLKAEEKKLPLTVRYLGCTQAGEHIELSWELSHPDGMIKLSERIPTANASGKVRVYRELRAESLNAGGSLILPLAYRDTWVLTTAEGKSVKSITGKAWHRLSLP